MLLRGMIAGICLLPPTFLMGATLPAISRWVETTPRGVSWLGFFYGGNIVGAVLGSVAAGFYLLRVHDLATATFVAAALNAAVAGVAFLLSRRTPSLTRGVVRSDDSTPPQFRPALRARVVQRRWFSTRNYRAWTAASRRAPAPRSWQRSTRSSPMTRQGSSRR